MSEAGLQGVLKNRVNGGGAKAERAKRPGKLLLVIEKILGGQR